MGSIILRLWVAKWQVDGWLSWLQGDGSWLQRDGWPSLFQIDTVDD
jgi:hypothetical protein